MARGAAIRDPIYVANVTKKRGKGFGVWTGGGTGIIKVISL